MSRIEILEHTADTGFRVLAPTLADLYETAILALAGVILDTQSARRVETVEIAAAGPDTPETLVNLLNEALYEIDANRFAPAAASAIEAREHGARLVLTGERRDDARHPPKLVVKAVTFHQLKVWNRDREWGAEVFLDI